MPLGYGYCARFGALEGAGKKAISDLKFERSEWPESSSAPSGAAEIQGLLGGLRDTQGRGASPAATAFRPASGPGVDGDAGRDSEGDLKFEI